MIIPDENDVYRERVRKSALKHGPRNRRGRIKMPAYKVRASDLVNQRLITWRLTRPPCEGCGTMIEIQGHHYDYSKPYEVDWLCRRCHGAEHRGALIKTGPKADPNILLHEPVKKCKLCECDRPVTESPTLKVFLCQGCLVEFKWCGGCNEILLRESFSKNQARCVPCCKIAYKASRAA